MAGSNLVIVKAGMWEVPEDFKCRKPEFAEYLDVAAPYDQQQRMGRMYWAVRAGEVVGYMMLALGHMGKERQADLGIDTYGPIPALVIARRKTRAFRAPRFCGGSCGRTLGQFGEGGPVVVARVARGQPLVVAGQGGLVGLYPLDHLVALGDLGGVDGFPPFDLGGAPRALL